MSKSLCKRWLAAALAACLMLTLAGCGGARTELKPFAEGDNAFFLGQYSLTGQGLSGLEQTLRQCVDLPAMLTVAYLEATVSKKAAVESFTLSLYGFNENKAYAGMYGFNYQGKSKKITYTAPKPAGKDSVTPSYNPNSEIGYLDGQIRRLPLEKQIAKLDFPRYVLQYQPGTKLPEATPILDGGAGQEFPVLSLDDYKNGAGGAGDGHTAVIFNLYDGTSRVSQNLMQYRCKPEDMTSLYGNRDFTMQCDYQISNNQISFTRDYGETWIKADLPEKDLAATLSFYRSSLVIPEGSYFISADSDEPIAFFYSDAPALRISKDNGATWQTVSLNVEFPAITRRFVGFTSKNEGYAALGTEWSMGAGESKVCLLTHDGGLTWEQKALPLAGTSKTLRGLAFADGNNGVAALKSGSDETWPTLYVTRDAADHWVEVTLPWEQVPKEVQYLTKADSLTYENGLFILTLGQDSNGKQKVSFQSASLTGGWAFVRSWTAVTHTVG